MNREGDDVVGLADRQQNRTRYALIAPARPAAASRPATQLFIADHRQYRRTP
jgi:hypothetical protein